VFVVSVIV